MIAALLKSELTYASQPMVDPPGVTYARGPRTKPGMTAQSRPPATSSQPIIDPAEIMSTARRAMFRPRLMRHEPTFPRTCRRIRPIAR